jgi:hypothetical protein
MAGGRKPGLWGRHPANIEDGTFARAESSLPGLLGQRPPSLARALNARPLAAPVYEEDVHLTLTEVLALAAGFGIAEAREIAYYNQDVDNDPSTTPMPLGPWDEVSGAGTKRRRLWHFTSAARRAQVKREYQQSGSTKDLGRYMHVLQDSYSHEGLGAIIGQIGTSVNEQGETVYNSPNPLDQAPWHEADDPSKNPPKARTMARHSYDELFEAKEYLVEHKKLARQHEEIGYDKIAKLVAEFASEPDKSRREAICNQIGSVALQARKQQEDADYAELRARMEETERRITRTIQPGRRRTRKRRP